MGPCLQLLRKPERNMDAETAKKSNIFTENNFFIGLISFMESNKKLKFLANLIELGP
jgi:hypothetical protein